MRILIVSQYFWPENFRINDLASGLSQRGHQVTVLTGIPNYPGGNVFDGYGWFKNLRQNYQGVQVIRVPLLARGNGGSVRLALNYASFALSASLLGPVVCRGNYDVIFVHEPSPITVGLPAIVMKWRYRIPLLFWVLDLWPESLEATGSVRSPWILDRVRSLVRFIYRYCDRVLVQSRGFIAEIARLGVGEDKIRYFPSWAEEVYQAAEPGPEAESAGPELPEGFRVMFAGNVGVAQDFETILAAAERCRERRDIHWIVLGDGRRFDWVGREVARRQLQDCVHLLGRHPMESMPGFFARADVMLVTLKHNPIWSLTIPAKIQSYLACGRPVVAALDGEGARIVEEADAGIACPAEDPEALANAVLAMHRTGRGEREEMGRRGYNYYREHFDREKLFSELERWMAEQAAATSGKSG